MRQTFERIHNLPRALEQQAVNFLTVTQILDISALVDVVCETAILCAHLKFT